MANSGLAYLGPAPVSPRPAVAAGIQTPRFVRYVRSEVQTHPVCGPDSSGLWSKTIWSLVKIIWSEVQNHQVSGPDSSCVRSRLIRSFEQNHPFGGPESSGLWSIIIESAAPTQLVRHIRSLAKITLFLFKKLVHTILNGSSGSFNLYPD